jgi:hypothetical protein
MNSNKYSVSYMRSPVGRGNHIQTELGKFRYRDALDSHKSPIRLISGPLCVTRLTAELLRRTWLPLAAFLTVQNRLAYEHVAVPDLQVEAAIRVRAHPRLVVDRCTMRSKVGQGQQVTGVTGPTI